MPEQENNEHVAQYEERVKAIEEASNQFKMERKAVTHCVKANGK